MNRKPCTIEYREPFYYVVESEGVVAYSYTYGEAYNWAWTHGYICAYDDEMN